MGRMSTWTSFGFSSIQLRIHASLFSQWLGAMAAATGAGACLSPFWARHIISGCYLGFSDFSGGLGTS